MADSPLAPNANDQAPNTSSAIKNPFATPALSPIDLPTAPSPVARPVSSTRLGYHTRPTALYADTDTDNVSYPYKSESMSSTGGSSSLTPLSWVDVEKDVRRVSDAQKHRSVSTERRSREKRNVDPEKAACNSPLGDHERARGRGQQRTVFREDEELEDARQLQEEKAVKILFFLSGPCVVLSLLNAVWTLISLTIVTLTQPVRICALRPTFGQQLGGLLGPALNLQLKSIYTPLPPHADEDMVYNTGMLLITQMLSPFLSLGLMIAAWVTAIFWLSSAVVGDPSGTDKRDDGRETVLSLRSWWEQWLVRSVRKE